MPIYLIANELGQPSQLNGRYPFPFVNVNADDCTEFLTVLKNIKVTMIISVVPMRNNIEFNFTAAEFQHDLKSWRFC